MLRFEERIGPTLQERCQAFEVVASRHQCHDRTGSDLVNTAQELAVHVPYVSEHVFDLGSAFSNSVIAPLLTGAQLLELCRAFKGQRGCVWVVERL